MASAPTIGGSARAVELDADAFGARFNGPLLHESVRAELAARRRGTASTRTRGLVSGGGAKPWRQKGTGRARAGSSRSPVWTGGGTVFGPHPRSYTFKVNRKERRAALRSALSLHADRGSLAILDVSAFAAPSTRTAARLLSSWGQPRSTLVVVTAEERDAALSFRNIDRVAVLEAASVGIADIVGAASLLCSESALAELTARASSTAKVEAAAAGSEAVPAAEPAPEAELKSAQPAPTPAKAASAVSAKAAPAAGAPASAPAKAKTAAKPKASTAAVTKEAAKPAPSAKTAEGTTKPRAAAAKKAEATAKPRAAAKKPDEPAKPRAAAKKADAATKPAATRSRKD
jgi:large subunit ribosomal protein L4